MKARIEAGGQQQQADAVDPAKQDAPVVDVSRLDRSQVRRGLGIE